MCSSLIQLYTAAVKRENHAFLFPAPFPKTNSPIYPHQIRRVFKDLPETLVDFDQWRTLSCLYSYSNFHKHTNCKLLCYCWGAISLLPTASLGGKVERMILILFPWYPETHGNCSKLCQGYSDWTLGIISLLSQWWNAGTGFLGRWSIPQIPQTKLRGIWKMLLIT